MKYWMAYVKEKKVTVFLYLVTVFLFLAMGTLNHMQNLEGLLYAGVMSLFLWSAAGIFYGVRYVRKRKHLEEALRYLEQTPEAFPDVMWGSRNQWVKEEKECGSLEGALLGLFQAANESYLRERSAWRDLSADRNDYYVMWTHQIKTPIAALRLLLKEGGRESFLLQEELFKIEQYVEMALAYQRLESMSSDLVLEKYDLFGLVKQAVKKYSLHFINKGLTLELMEQRVAVVTDEKWFVFCLEQFLSNSVKYTNAGKITIWAGQAEDRVLLYLEDEGIGIRKEDLPRIFERGFTGYNGRIDKRSTGIGLYLCHRVLKDLGIAVSVESEEGKGTKVELALVPAKE